MLPTKGPEKHMYIDQDLPLTSYNMDMNQDLRLTSSNLYMDEDVQLLSYMYMAEDLPSRSNPKKYRKNIKTFGETLEIETKKIYGEIEEIEDEVERRFNPFKSFDIISGHPPSDHHYLKNSNPMLFFSGSRFKRRIEQEWNLLSEKLPSSIFIRTYEKRIDLMRAAIIGPPGSVHDHCLFFFDIFFPRNYPSNPPKFHYRSYGIDLNPRLQPDGRVLLNLQESWYDRLKQKLQGSDNKEKWNSKESNVLDVLQTIQNLILNVKPHSPDPSCLYPHAKSGSVKKYNEKVFMLACEKMIRILRNPPTNFEVFVMGHFRRRAHPVLLIFKERQYDSELMIDLFVKLFKVFERNGTYCKHHLGFLTSRKEQISTGGVEARIRNDEGYRFGEDDPYTQFP